MYEFIHSRKVDDDFLYDLQLKFSRIKQLVVDRVLLAIPNEDAAFYVLLMLVRVELLASYSKKIQLRIS